MTVDKAADIEDEIMQNVDTQSTVLVPATPEPKPEETHRGQRNLPGIMRGGNSQNRSRARLTSKMGPKDKQTNSDTRDIDPSKLLMQTMMAILKVPGMSLVDAFIAVTNIVEAKTKERRDSKMDNAKPKLKPTSFAEAARQGPAFNPEMVVG